MTVAIGSDGTAALPAGWYAELNTWAATLTRTTQVITGFGDAGQSRRASAVHDITGTIGGMPQYNAVTTIPFPASGSPIVPADSAGGELVLTVATGCTFTFDAVFSSYAFNVTQDGANTITYSFEMNDSAGVTVAWDETAP
jgi:hypothetical protein